MFQALVSTANRLLGDVQRTWQGNGRHGERMRANLQAGAFQRLERIILTDEVSRTLFEEFDTHQKSARGREETGWELLGIRRESDVVVLATLPAGAHRDAGVAHVQFNHIAQALASRIVRQQDRRLTIVGVVHTHPGSLRHPSSGDYQGDSVWVGQLRGRDGIFGIGTADVAANNGKWTPPDAEPHRQIFGKLCFSWFGLRQGDRRYRPLPVSLILGPDLAKPLHPVWPTIEYHAPRLERLCEQMSKVAFRVVPEKDRAALIVEIGVADGNSLRLVLQGESARYLLFLDGDVVEVDPAEPQVDRAVYQILAELAKRA